MLVPIFLLGPSDLWSPVRMALGLTVLLDLASAVVLFRALRAAADEKTATVGAILWLASPFSFFLGMRGMEASLSVFLLLLLLLL